CTGSSIMPQKKNPDGLELLRSRLAGISSRSAEIKMIIRALPSGYNRDFQDIKEPFLACLENTLQSIQVAELVFDKLVLHEDALRAAHRSEIFATDEALRLVEEGMPFREAYHHVAAHLDKLKTYNIDETLQSRRVRGYPAQLGLEQAKSDLSRLSKIQKKQEEQHFTALKNLLGEGARLLGTGANLLGDGARASAL
ncbi:MAG: lyase family protein, partial [Salinispira sp.]